MKGIYLQNKYPILLKNNNANVLNPTPHPRKREHEKKQQKEYRNNYL